MSSLNYTLSNSLEFRTILNYIKVPKGQGTHIWTDYNSNSIKELNEFEVPYFQYDAEYIRYYQLTNSYQKAYQKQFQFQLHVEPVQFIKNEQFVFRLLTRLSDNLQFSMSQKDLIDAFSFSSDKDSNILSENFFLTNTVYYKSLNKHLILRYDYLKTNSKEYLNYGSAYKSKNVQNISVLVLFKKIHFENKFSFENSKSKNELSIQNQFDIESVQNIFSIKEQNEKNNFTSLNYRIKISKNNSGTEESKFQQVQIHTEQKLKDSNQLSAEFNIISAKVTRVENQAAVYQMIEGYENGLNYSWNLNWEKAINKFLFLNFSYEGRKHKSALIHNGTVRIKAQF